MDEDVIKNYLEAGHQLGIRISLDDYDYDYLGWILVSKLASNPRVLELLEGEDEEEFPVLKEERRRAVTPFLIRDIELKRSVHESGDYETEADFRKKDMVWCSSLTEINDFLKTKGYRLTDLEDSRTIDAP
jgi:hypothetical protein